MTPAQEAWLAMRRGDWTGRPFMKCPGTSRVTWWCCHDPMPMIFLLYCQRNPKPCPLIDVTDASDPRPRLAAPDADIRTDLPRYSVYRNGSREEDVTSITELWTEESVAFLIGSSLTFDEALERAGVPKSVEVWLLNTTVPTIPAGKFSGSLIVTMRWMTRGLTQLG